MSAIKQIPLCIPYTDEQEIEAITEVIRSGWLAHGPKNKEFEHLFADYVGVKYAIAMNSCASALHLAVEALGIKGEVIVPSFTFVASANAIITGGAQPVFADIEEDTCNICPASIERMISSRAEAIMPVHFGGQTANMTRIMEIAEKQGLAIIEDSAETIGGTHHGKQAGSFGIGCFSFFPTKNMTIGEGGMLTTDDEELASKIRCLMGHGIDKTTFQREREGNPWIRAASRVGYNFRVTNFQAAMGIVQLKKLDEMNIKRQMLAEQYTVGLQDNENIILPKVCPENTHVYQMYTVQLRDPNCRSQLVETLKEQGIGASVHFSPAVHEMLPYEGDQYRQDDLRVTDKICSCIVTLPMYPGMVKEDTDYICEKLNAFFSA